MSKKLTIAFEGIEGSGKSFHLNNVSKYLKKKNKDFIAIREPGGTKNSEKIRRLILDTKSKFSQKTDLFLYLASRNENIELNLKPNHHKKIILIDRFIDSTIAYQHFGMGINKQSIVDMNKFILGNFKVDFTFLNIVNKKNMIDRLNNRKKLNRYDKFKISFYEKVQKGFIKIASSNSRKYFLIDSNNEIEENKTLIINKIKKILEI
jgi:dTMP kinase